MLKSYFTSALRNFLGNKTFSLIHILGLSIGICASLIIYQIVRYELSFDKFEKDSDRLYRVVMDMNFDGGEAHSPSVPAPLGGAIMSETSGIESSIPVMQFQGDATAKVSVVSVLNTLPTLYKKQPGIVFTNLSYFEMMPFRWIAGDRNKSLTEPFTAVLTENRARQYFPQLSLSEIIGRRIVYNDELEVFVTGIVGELHQPTDFSAVEFISFATIAKTHLEENFMMTVWDDWMAYSKLYLKLTPGKKPSDVEQQLAALMTKHNPRKEKGKNTMAFRLQPLGDIHFNNTYAGFGQRTASKNVLLGLLAIAAFLLLLGCINFTNLSTAAATRRMKEISIRKTIGGSRKQLIIQFLGETLLITTIAAFLSLCLIPVMLDFFAGFTPPGLKFEMFSDPFFIIFLPALVLLVSFFSGFYPALVLSRYQPAAVLRNQATTSGLRSASVRKVLTVFQFVIAQFFVIAALIVTLQIQFSLNSDLGYRRNAILNIDIPRGDSTEAPLRRQFHNRLTSLSGIEMISTGFLPPAISGGAFGNVSYDDGKHETKVAVQVRWGDANYLKVYDIKLAAGRNILPGENINEGLINENYVHELGIKDPSEVLGQQFEFSGKKVSIVGVMKDFHEGSFHNVIGPVVFQSNSTGNTFHIVLTSNARGENSWTETISKIGEAWSAVYPDHDFEYKFYDDTIAEFYKTERNTAQLLNWAMGLTILISCLGLLGLVMYTSLARTKEIGVRKILGASVANLVAILSLDFIKPVLLAFVIAAPLAAWAMNKWLSAFAYQTIMSWWIFAAAGGLMLFAAVVTLSFQTISIAIERPVKNLRNE